MKKTVVSILGATGLVGADVVSALSQFHGELRLFASPDSVGEVYKVGDEEVVIQLPTQEALKGSDIVLCCLPPAEAKKFLPIAVDSGAVVIDNSGVLKELHPDSSLTVPAIEHSVGKKKNKLFSLPSPVTTQLAPVLYEISKHSSIESIQVVALCAVSTSGRAGLDELWEQTRSIFTQTESPREVFASQVAFNCVPVVGGLSVAQHQTTEELRVEQELREVLKIAHHAIDIAMVRVPVFHCHSTQITVQTKGAIDTSVLTAALEKIPGIVLHTDAESLPEPVTVAGEEGIHVGRIRQNKCHPHALSLWTVADNIRYGAVRVMLEAVEQFTAEQN